MTYEPDVEAEMADHHNEMAAELAELRVLAETVDPHEEERPDPEWAAEGAESLRAAVEGSLGRSVGMVLPGWAR